MFEPGNALQTRTKCAQIRGNLVLFWIFFIPKRKVPFKNVRAATERGAAQNSKR
jgi:hypothetical protein